MMLLITVVLLMVSALEANRCPEFCAGNDNDADESCNRATLACLEGCKEGYYGKTCSSTCDVKCLSKSCQQEDGACICRSGYSRMMGKCQRTKGTTCKLEYHCKENICKAVGRKQCVYGCVAGWFGEFCDIKCTDSCVCDQISGACTDCVTGWYGEECGSRCSSGCVGENCNRNGNCIQGCKPGSYGESCMLQCSRHCVSGCDQLSGECVQCEAGRYGSTCQCSDRCAGSKADCDKDGRCIKGCIKGYYGEKCESNCSQQCHGDVCNKNGTCSACKNGFFENFCQQPCSGCIDGVCDQTTGECTEGCLGGHYGSSCKLTCEICDDGNCDQKTGKCTVKSSGVNYWVGAGVAIVIIIIATGLGYLFCRLKRIDGAIYNVVKWKRRPLSVVQGASPTVAPGYTVIDDESTVTPPNVCPISPIRRHSYIRPRHDVGSTNSLQSGSSENLPPSHWLLQNVLRRSDELSDSSNSYVLPNYSELNEDMMATLPQRPQGPDALTPVFNNSFSAVADVHVQLEHLDEGNATGGDIRMPLIAQCFGNTETEDSSPDEEPRPDDENYDHPFRENVCDDDRNYDLPEHKTVGIPDKKNDVPEGIPPHNGEGNANGGDIRMPLIAQYFGNTGTEDTSPDEEPRPDDENYNQPLREDYG